MSARGSLRDFPLSTEISGKGTAIGTKIDMQKILRIASQGILHVEASVRNLSGENKVLFDLKNRKSIVKQC